MQVRVMFRLVVLALILSACARPAASYLPTPTVMPTPSLVPAPSPTPFVSPLYSPVESVAVSPLPVPTWTPTPPPLSRAPWYTYRVVNVYPHDPGAFTQGLVYLDGQLYEGTGLYGASSLRRVELETGRVLQQHDLSGEYFGEGIAVLGDKIYQLTWQSQVGFVYDRATFSQLKQFTYPTEGWGLTHDGQRLIMSDGSARLYFLDPDTLTRIGEVTVRDGEAEVFRLNELEYINGEVWANVWQTNLIVRIDPRSGQVLGWIDLSGLLSPEDLTRPVDVLNGIAFDPDSGRIWVTGKWWPKLFEIEVLPKN